MYLLGKGFKELKLDLKLLRIRGIRGGCPRAISEEKNEMP